MSEQTGINGENSDVTVHFHHKREKRSEEKGKGDKYMIDEKLAEALHSLEDGMSGDSEKMKEIGKQEEEKGMWRENDAKREEVKMKKQGYPLLNVSSPDHSEADKHEQNAYKEIKQMEKKFSQNQYKGEENSKYGYQLSHP
jgi:hypothetical protein